MSAWFRTYGFGDILPELLIGAYPTDPDDVRMLAMMKVTRVLNLVQDEEYDGGEREAVAAALAEAGIEEHRIDLVDFGGLPATAIEEAVGIIEGWLDDGQRVYAHCRAGWQRSATIAAAVVVDRNALGPDEALAFVKQQKPSADPLPHQRLDLLQWYVGRSSPA